MLCTEIIDCFVHLPQEKLTKEDNIMAIVKPLVSIDTNLQSFVYPSNNIKGGTLPEPAVV